MQKYYEKDNIRLFLGDCIEILQVAKNTHLSCNIKNPLQNLAIIGVEPNGRGTDFNRHFSAKSDF